MAITRFEAAMAWGRARTRNGGVIGGFFRGVVFGVFFKGNPLRKSLKEINSVKGTLYHNINLLKVSAKVQAAAARKELRKRRKAYKNNKEGFNQEMAQIDAELNARLGDAEAESDPEMAARAVGSALGAIGSAVMRATGFDDSRPESQAQRNMRQRERARDEATRRQQTDRRMEKSAGNAVKSIAQRVGLELQKRKGASHSRQDVEAIIKEAIKKYNKGGRNRERKETRTPSEMFDLIVQYAKEHPGTSIMSEINKLSSDTPASRAPLGELARHRSAPPRTTEAGHAAFSRHATSPASHHHSPGATTGTVPTMKGNELEEKIGRMATSVARKLEQEKNQGKSPYNNERFLELIQAKRQDYTRIYFFPKEDKLSNEDLMKAIIEHAKTRNSSTYKALVKNEAALMGTPKKKSWFKLR